MSNNSSTVLVTVGFLIFVGIWGYSFYKWGFLKALAIGWLPAMVGAGVGTVILSLFLNH
jgi:hypothetical protein